jgi:hypothetical protein
MESSPISLIVRTITPAVTICFGSLMLAVIMITSFMYTSRQRDSSVDSYHFYSQSMLALLCRLQLCCLLSPSSTLRDQSTTSPSDAFTCLVMPTKSIMCPHPGVTHQVHQVHQVHQRPSGASCPSCPSYPSCHRFTSIQRMFNHKNHHRTAPTTRVTVIEPSSHCSDRTG